MQSWSVALSIVPNLYSINRGEGIDTLSHKTKTIMKRKIIDKVIETGRGAAVFAGVGYGASKIIDSLSRVSDKKPKSIKKFGYIIVSISVIVTAATSILLWCKKRSGASAYTRERRADGDLYTVQKMADENLIRTKAKAGVYRVPKQSPDANAESNYNADLVDDDDAQEQHKLPWIEVFKSKFTMPLLPPFLAKIMSGVPKGYEEAMMLHLLSMLGAMCFSKVRALYSDGIVHAANLQVIVEGNYGAGKAKFEQLFKELFLRIIRRSLDKIEQMNEEDNDDSVSIIQTTGIGTSMARFVDILAANNGCHMYLFNSEIRALAYDLKKGNGINFDFLRKAFENGDVCRNNKAKDSQNGIFPVYLNYTITGTPLDITTSFKKELEGGTLSRIAWTCIPEAGRYPGVLRLPDGQELEEMRNQIDDWTNKYCCHFIPEGDDEPVEEVRVDLDYVCKALDTWNDHQYEQSVTEDNPARKDVRLRMAAIAFHCAIVIHMLYDNPTPSNWQKRKQVVDLTLFIADYCIERFLHKFGKNQNIQRKLNLEAELVDNEPKPIVEPVQKQVKELITDIKTLKELHDIKDENGQSKNGWDRLAILSGMSSSTVKRKVREYEASLAH